MTSPHQLDRTSDIPQNLSIRDGGFNLASAVAEQRTAISIALGRDQATLDPNCEITLEKLSAFSQIFEAYLTQREHRRKFMRKSEDLASIQWFGRLLQFIFQQILQRTMYKLVLSTTTDNDNEVSEVLNQYRAALTDISSVVSSDDQKAINMIQRLLAQITKEQNHLLLISEKI